MDIIDLTIDDECGVITIGHLIEQYFKYSGNTQLDICSKVGKGWLRKQGKTKLLKS